VKKKIIKKCISAPQFLNEPIDYAKSFSRGLRVPFSEATILFISGTASVDHKGRTYRPYSFAQQVKRTYANLTALLRSEGATWHDVVQTRCYLKSMRFYEEFNVFRNQFYKKEKLKPFPASVCIEANLCRPELLVEIEAIAVIKN
jgi:2-iminobutanoate/2-iminopropanoate deaminase